MDLYNSVDHSDPKFTDIISRNRSSSQS